MLVYYKLVSRFNLSTVHLLEDFKKDGKWVGLFRSPWCSSLWGGFIWTCSKAHP